MEEDEEIDIELKVRCSEEGLWALAQFVKRVTWYEIRTYSVDEAEAHAIVYGIGRLQLALREEGFAPR